MKFKPGDKVFSFRHGIVTIVETEDAFTSGFSIGVKTEIGIEGHTAEGRCLIKDKHPCIITLEEAEKRGFVRKKVKPHKGLRVRCYDTKAKEYAIAYALYGSVSDFEHKNHHNWLFVSFVDDQLRDCPPPQETIEWEEI
jgi:hypothetical protein